MYNLIRALDIENNIEGLRYDKVILATVADVDGLHIRNLLITYFFKFFDQVVHDGHLYVLETPLFRVRNKQETIYCYSEAERDAASAKLGGKPEITRFKGLGNAREPGGIRAQSGQPANPLLLHGQEHARPEGYISWRRATEGRVL